MSTATPPPLPQRIIMPRRRWSRWRGWLVPGLGYVLIGQRARGAVIGVTILLMFTAGLLIGGMRVIDSAFIESTQEREDRASQERIRKSDSNYRAPTPVMRTLQKPWFIGQFFAGPVTLIANYVGATWGGDKGAPFSHARVYEIGVLYAAVAGMMNLMAIIDSAYRSGNGGAR